MLESTKKMVLDMELRGMAESTLKSYPERVQLFIKFSGKDIQDIEINDIRNYIIHLKDVKKLSFGTINAHISALKFFFSITLGKDWDKRVVPRMRGYEYTAFTFGSFAPCPTLKLNVTTSAPKTR